MAIVLYFFVHFEKHFCNFPATKVNKMNCILEKFDLCKVGLADISAESYQYVRRGLAVF